MPPIQCWDITEQLGAQTLTFCSTLGQGQGEEGKKRGKKKNNNLPNTFDDDRSKLKAAGFLLGLVVKFFEFT